MGVWAFFSAVIYALIDYILNISFGTTAKQRAWENANNGRCNVVNIEGSNIQQLC
jgi:hypothetical protein